MPVAHLMRRRRDLGSDEGGMAAIEFALLAPVFVMLYLGLAELTMALMAERRVAHAASVMGDLVAQTPQIKQSEVTDVFTVGGSIMNPFSATPLHIRITGVTADVNGTPKVVWSQGSGMTALSANATVTVPNNLLAAGDSVVEAEVQYSYVSPLLVVLPNALSFSSTFYLKPRRSPAVTYLAGQ